MLKEITKNTYYIGVNDNEIDLFEGQYKVPNGVTYNSYLIVDEKIALLDTTDKSKKKEWLENLENTLNTIAKGRTVDYLIVSHLEDDHSRKYRRCIKQIS